MFSSDPPSLGMGTGVQRGRDLSEALVVEDGGLELTDLGSNTSHGSWTNAFIPLSLGFLVCKNREQGRAHVLGVIGSLTERTP